MVLNRVPENGGFVQKTVNGHATFSMNPDLKMQKKQEKFAAKAAEEADQRKIDAFRAASMSAPIYYPRLTQMPVSAPPAAPQLESRKQSSFSQGQQRVLAFIQGLDNGWMPFQLADRLKKIQEQNLTPPPSSPRVDPRAAVREMPEVRQAHPKCRIFTDF